LKRNILFSNKTGRALKTPVTVDIPEPRSGVEKALQEEVIEARMFKMPRLIPFASVENSLRVVLTSFSKKLLVNLGFRMVQ